MHLIDSHHCSDPSKFLSVLLLSLSSMTQLELPHVNVLSKMDLIEQYGALEFGLEFYTDVLDLSYLLPRLKAQQHNASHPLARKYARLHAAIADLVESYNLVSFVPLDVQNAELLAQVLKVVDKANGYMYVQESSAATGQGAAASTTAGMQQRNLLTAVDQSQLHDLHLSVTIRRAHTHRRHSGTHASGGRRRQAQASRHISLTSARPCPVSPLLPLLISPDIQERYMPRTTQEPETRTKPKAASQA